MSPNRFAFAAAIALSAGQARGQTPSPQSAERVAMPVIAAQAVPQVQYYVPYVPAKPSTNHAITMKPGPLSHGVAWLGRQLAKADRTHVWQWQHHRLIPLPAPTPAPAGLVPMPAPMAAPRASAQAPAPPSVTSDGVPILRIPDPIAEAVPGPNDVREVR